MFRYFETRIDPFPPEAPTAPPRGLLPFILHYSKPVQPWLVLMAALAASVAIIEITFLSFLGTLVDWLAVADRETFFADHGGRLLAMGALIVVGFPLAVMFASTVQHQVIAGNYPMLGRWLMHRHMLGQSMSFFQDEFAGRISQKVMQTALAVRDTVMKVLDVFVYISIYFIGAMVLLGQQEPWMMAPLVLWLAVYFAILFYFVPRLRRISMKQADARAQMTGRVVDSYTNIQTIKLFAHTDREQGYAREAMDGFMQTVYPQMRLATLLTVCLQTSNALLLASIAFLGIWSWQQATISLGAIAVSIALVLRIRGMSDWILWEVAGLFENIGTVQDGINTLARAASVVDTPEARAIEVTQGMVRFEQLRFHYGKGGGVIEDFNLSIHPGERVGLVGRSGAGKSTLVNLLLRFYDAEGGRILIDGQDIRHVTQGSLRQQIGMVTQDTSLLHRSIRDNLRYGRPDASEAEILEAARRAHALDFIETLCDAEGRRGLDAHVGERGVKLSGGQRQRIAIARVLLKNAPILVLDEATSALDSEVEAAIQEQLYTLMEGKTVIAIAHRLSTIAALDRLVVIDQGRVLESGTHAELLAANGLYAALWARQSGGFLGVDPI